MKILRASTAVAGLVTLALGVGPARAQDSIRMATSWPGGAFLDYFAKGFANNAEKLTNGKVKFQVFPGGTIGSALKVTETVQKKIAPAGNASPNYDWGVDKTGVIFAGYVGSPGIEAHLHWLYEAGGAKMWAEWRMEKFGLVAMPCGAHSDEIHMHSRKPVTKPEDLKGLKLRTAGAWAEVAGLMGASTVILSGGEVYPALERGVVDAIEWGTPSINIPLGFHKIAKYVILPGLHQPAAVQECIFDKALWEGFDAHTKFLLEEAAKKTTLESWMQLTYLDTAALGKFKEEGAEVLFVDPSYVEAVKKATREWEDKTAAENPWFKRALENKREFEARWNGAKAYRSELK
ncbi:MAG TPA: TRAP transporter substrate-binding protein DctP [Hyphomicrobiaceae bacterium]|nr:TRAP transporter substrate-binding protein DctP [Hyphomicrobiaceae bacterium]